jgi:hypothetical protein
MFRVGLCVYSTCNIVHFLHLLLGTNCGHAGASLLSCEATFTVAKFVTHDLRLPFIKDDISIMSFMSAEAVLRR